MTPDEIMSQVNEVFIETLDDPKVQLRRDATAEHIPEWDSLNHILIVVAIEKKFGLRFTSAQIQGWKNVGAMCDDIAQKLAAK